MAFLFFFFLFFVPLLWRGRVGRTAVLDAPSLFRFSGAARIPSTFHLFYVRAVTGLHCLGFNVFDFVASCNGWVSGAAGATSVVLGHLGPGCLCITWALAKNNLVPTVTVSFDALEAGDTVEGLFDFV